MTEAWLTFETRVGRGADHGVNADRESWLERRRREAEELGYDTHPNFPGQDVFAGEQQHSSEHPGPDAYAAKRVVVVGSNNSAFDICGALYEAGAEVTMVHVLVARGCFASRTQPKQPPGANSTSAPPALWAEPLAKIVQGTRGGACAVPRAAGASPAWHRCSCWHEAGRPRGGLHVPTRWSLATTRADDG